MNATMLHNSQIGDNCVIAAGAVVTEGMKIPSNSFVVGVPARVKGTVTEEQRGWTDGHFAFYPPLAKRYKDQKL